MASSLPDKGMTEEDILSQVQALSGQDMRWEEGRFFGYLYYPGESYYKVIKNAYARFSATNALNPAAFPSLRMMENDIVSISAQLLGGNASTAGTLTSGGTESIFLAVMAARSFAKKKGIERPNIIVASSAHPAFNKAAEILGVNIITLPVTDTFRMDVDLLQKTIDADTTMVVASAPSYPQGIIDPVVQVAAIASSSDILCHVDACVGGFILPFLKMNGVDLPAFDLSVPGVTSISADLHKYGYAAKGASVLLFADKEIRKGHYYVRTDWSGGIYGSTSLSGTRGGGPIAAAWTALHHIGTDGYRMMAREVYQEVAHIKQRILAEIPELYIPGQPVATLFSLASDKVDIYEVADHLTGLGWMINRQQKPASLHVLLNYIHVGKGDRFVEDLKSAVARTKTLSLQKLRNKAEKALVKGIHSVVSAVTFQKLASKLGSGQESKRTAAMYGMMNELPADSALEEVVKDMLSGMYQKEE